MPVTPVSNAWAVFKPGVYYPVQCVAVQCPLGAGISYLAFFHADVKGVFHESNKDPLFMGIVYSASPPTQAQINAL